MISGKKVFVGSLLGLIMGLWSYLGGSWCGVGFTPGQILIIITTEILLGFVISVSALKWKPFLHGSFWGFAVNLPMALSAIDVSPSSFFVLISLGIWWGILIEKFLPVFLNVNSPLEVYYKLKMFCPWLK